MTVPRAPGEFLLDRFVPDAPPEKREEAREAFHRLAKLLVAIGARLDAEVPAGRSRSKP